MEERILKLAELKTDNNPFSVVKYDVDTYSKDIHERFEDFNDVSIAGRIMTKRIMGKASFCDVQDSTGRIQIYVRRDDIADYSAFKRYDIGDFIGVKGFVFKTQKGEISIHAQELTLLSKGLRALPEKFHGLTDQELRYRQRYLDLIVNDDVKKDFVIRSSVIKNIRRFLDEQGYLEVETPILQTIAGGASARPFITHHNALDIDMYMRIALELPLKKLIIGGFDKVYELGRVFRNEGISIKHNPEFTMLELYAAYQDYNDMMLLTENLIRFIAKDVLGTSVLTYGEYQFDFSKPFERITMLDAVLKYTGVDFNALSDAECFVLAREHKLELKDYYTKGDVLNLFFETFVEDKLIQPTFLLDHPVEISPLTKRKPDNPNYTERFELYIAGREFANAYSELNDPQDQRERFMHQEKLRAAGDNEANMLDEEFLTAMEYGMPPTGGLGIGIDRLVMLFTNAPSIRDVLLFPTMKPIVF